MLSIRGIYEGGNIKFLENIKIEGPKRCYYNVSR